MRVSINEETRPPFFGQRGSLEGWQIFSDCRPAASGLDQPVPFGQFTPVITAILLFISTLSLAQNPHTLWFHTLSSRQGLAQNYNWYVLKDSKGFVWISSISGLNRFDGYEVKRYNAVQGDTTSLLGENVYSEFFEDGQQNIWFCTPDAIHCYQRKHDNFRRYTFQDECNEPINQDYQVFYLEKDSFLWVKAGTGIYRLDIHQPYRQPIKVTESEQFYCRVGLDQYKSVNRLYLFGSKKGVEAHHVHRGRFVSMMKQSTGSVVISLLPRSEKLVWLTTAEQGLARWDPSLPPPNNWQSGGVFPSYPSTICPWGAHKFLVFAAGKGIFQYDEAKNSLTAFECRFMDGDDSALQSMRGGYIDSDDNLWLTGKDNGLYYANLFKSKFRSLPKPKLPGLSSKFSYWAFVEDSNGNVWHGTSSAGLFLTDKAGKLLGHFMHQSGRPNSLPPGRIMDLAHDAAKRRIWVVSENYLAWCSLDRPGHFRKVSSNLAGDYPILVHILQTSQGKLLVSSGRQGIFEVVEGKNGPYLFQHETTDGHSFQTIMEDGAGRLFAARDADSICVFKHEGGVLTLTENLTLGGIINGFQEDKANKLNWFATSDGLFMLDKNKPDAPKRVFTTRDGLPGNCVGEIAADQHGRVWLGTDQGLACFEGRFDGLRSFSLADGTQSPDFHLTAVMTCRNGDLWFGGSNGITIVPANGGFGRSGSPPKVLLTAIKVHGETPSPPIVCEATQATNPAEIRRFSLPHTENTVSFEFVAAEYSDPSNNQLQYKLEGLDDRWVELKKGEPGAVRFAGLDPGTYTLWAKAANSDGLFGSNLKLVTFTIKPPWWMTPWAIALWVAIFAAAIFAGYKYQVRKIKEKAERLRKEAEYKQREAEYRQQEAEIKQQMSETETAVLRLQMNPHFIFNSMNSIKSYIQQKDIATADRYLGRFAKLMRSILDLAAKPRIAIADEIELLVLYMDTEAMRFEQKFDHEITVDDALDAEETYIPTMILQPFVENAIWHGLSAKEGPGLVRIGFEKEGDMVVCTVEDNGLGRKAAAEKKSGGHGSKALSITDRRLQLLMEETGLPASYKIIDLTDDLGNPLGTRVEVRVPFLD